jgi:hypothetical protein
VVSQLDQGCSIPLVTKLQWLSTGRYVIVGRTLSMVASQQIR